MRRPILMKEISVRQVDIYARPAEKARNYQRSRRRWLVLLLISVFATLFMAACGFALAALSLLHVIETYGRLATIGVGLIAATFPTLIFAAHCLDRIDDADHAIKMDAYNEKLLDITNSDDSK
jgi:hypothetical protein